MSRSLVTGELPQRPEGSDKGGAPNKLQGIIDVNPEVIQSIKNYLLLGMSLESTASLVGVNPTTFRRWLKNGLEDGDSIYGELYRQVIKTLASAEVRDLSIVDNAVQGRPAEYMKDKEGNLILDGEGKPVLIAAEIKPDWKAAAWKLSKMNPKRWGDKLGVTFDSDVLPKYEEKDVTPEKREKSREELKDTIKNLQVLIEMEENGEF